MDKEDIVGKVWAMSKNKFNFANRIADWHISEIKKAKLEVLNKAMDYCSSQGGSADTWSESLEEIIKENDVK